MRCITTQNQERLRDWLCRVGDVEYPDNTMCIGQEKDGELIAVVGYNNFAPNACQIHVASTDVQWLTRELLFAIFDYPFNKLKVKVILAPIGQNNYKSLNLCRKLGFRLVADVPYCHKDGNLILMAMEYDRCKWL